MGATARTRSLPLPVLYPCRNAHLSRPGRYRSRYYTHAASHTFKDQVATAPGTVPMPHRTHLKTDLSVNLHMARLSPRLEKEERPDQRQHQGRFPDGGPASA